LEVGEAGLAHGAGEFGEAGGEASAEAATFAIGVLGFEELKAKNAGKKVAGGLGCAGSSLGGAGMVEKDGFGEGSGEAFRAETGEKLAEFEDLRSLG
jgi:hypothetical protein